MNQEDIAKLKHLGEQSRSLQKIIDANMQEIQRLLRNCKHENRNEADRYTLHQKPKGRLIIDYKCVDCGYYWNTYTYKEGD